MNTRFVAVCVVSLCLFSVCWAFPLASMADDYSNDWPHHDLGSGTSQPFSIA